MLVEVVSAVVAPLGRLGGGDELGAAGALLPSGAVGGSSVLCLRAAEGLVGCSAGFMRGGLPLLGYRSSVAVSTEGVVGLLGGEPDPAFVASAFAGGLASGGFGSADGLAGAVAVTVRVPGDCAAAFGAPGEIQDSGEGSGCSLGRPGVFSGDAPVAIGPAVRAAVGGVSPGVVSRAPHTAGSTDAPLRSGEHVGPALSGGHHR